MHSEQDNAYRIRELPPFAASHYCRSHQRATAREPCAAQSLREFTQAPMAPLLLCRVRAPSAA